MDKVLKRIRESRKFNEHFHIYWYECYLRLGPRYIDRVVYNRCLDFSTIVKLDPTKPSKFDEILETMESWLGKDIDALFIENVLNERLHIKYTSRNYLVYSNDGFGTCYYKLPSVRA